MASLAIDYPSVLQDIYYKPNLGPASYNSELPQDFAYDPGATSGLYELGYIPSQQSFIPLLGLGLLFLFVIVFIIRRGGMKQTFTYLMIISLCLAFLGPLRLPGLVRFQTTLGVAKAIALFSLFIGGFHDFVSREKSIFRQSSLITISLYGAVSFASIFWVTNVNFFMSDMNLIITGLVFYFACFYHIKNTEDLRLLSNFLGHVILIPALLVISIFLFPYQGTLLMSGLYPRYENIVFNFDMARDRILSVVDLEFLIPFVCYLYVVSKSKLKASIIFTGVFMGVLLTNYRYRFLSFGVGGVSYMLLSGKQNIKKMFLSATVIAIGVFCLYMVISLLLGRTTIIDRFLLKSYVNDVDSLRRRGVMARQAVDLFSQFPILGVGVGNYKDNVQVFIETFGGRTYEPTYKVLQNVYAYPHNWFLLVLAENGIVGFLIVVWLLYGFFKIDRYLYKTLVEQKKLLFLAFSLTSWLYVFANLFTPLHNSLPMVIVFWSCRGIIERMHYSKTIESLQ